MYQGRRNRGGGYSPQLYVRVGVLSPPKEFMKNKGIEEFQEHFYKLAATGSDKPLNYCLPPKIQISYIMI